MNLTKSQFALSLSLAICYLLFLVSYVIISIATLSASYNLVPLALILGWLLAIISLFSLQLSKRKTIISLLALIASAIFVLVYIVWFSLVDMQNINAMLLRMGGKATTKATMTDYFVCPFLLVEALTSILIAVLATLAFFSLSKKNKGNQAKRKAFIVIKILG